MLLFALLVLSLPFLWVLWRRPVLRRLALRNAVRRPREAALVVLGSMFGTAIITGSLVVGDTIDSSIRSLAYTRLGPIDQVVVTQDPEQHHDVLAAVRETRTELVDGVIGFARVPVTTASGEGADVRAVPRSDLIEIDFEAARAFGTDPAITGIDGPTPAPGHVVVTRELADPLDVARGDTLDVFVYGKQQRFVIDRVIDARGFAGFATGFFSQPSRNLIAAPGTIDELLRGAEADIAAGRFVPPDRIVAVSNVGGVEESAVHTSAVVALLADALEGRDLQVLPVKQEVLDDARETASSFQELFTAMGTFGVLAGVLLLVNIFVMLGEERKAELGMLRAVGLRRAGLVGAFSTEGWAYAVMASAIGTGLGLGLGRVIILVVERIFDNDLEGFGVPLRFSASAESVELGFVAGLAIALAAVVITSVRISRFNVIRAIRDLPEPRRIGLRLRWLVVGALAAMVGSGVTSAGFAAAVFEARVIGPVLVLAGLGVLMARWLPTRGLTTAVSALVLLWAGVGIPLLGSLDEGGIFTFVIQGIVLTGAAVVLVSQEHDRFERAARRLGSGRWALAVRLGLAYPVARRLRTGLTLAMYSLVIFTLTFITVLSATFTDQVDETARRISGGYDVFLRSSPSNPVPLDELRGFDGVTGVAPIATVPVDVVRIEGEDSQRWGISGFDERLLAGGAPELSDRGVYRTDEAAYEAVLADPELVLVDRFFLQGGGGPPDFRIRPGDRLVIANPFSGEEREVTVAAVAADDFLFNGALYGLDHLGSMYGDLAVPNRFYVSIEGEPAAMAAGLSGRFLEHGAEADPIRDLLGEFIAVQRQFFELFRGYLGLGLLVGIAGLGVVMVRAVRERRREIGVLRALGFQSETVRRSFVLEAGFVALEGTLIGVSLALLTAFNVMNNTDAFGETATFVAPVGALALIVLGTLAVSLLATAAPTRAAARIRPAVALRIAD